MKQLLLFLLLITSAASAQAPLRGRVQDAAGRPVPYASVAVPALKQGATADAEGAFALPLPPGTYQLEISAVGYQSVRPTVTLPLSKPLSIRLASAEQAIGEVVVTGVSRSTELRRSPVPIAALSRREMQLNANTNAIDAAVRGVPGLTAVTTGPNISKPL